MFASRPQGEARGPSAMTGVKLDVWQLSLLVELVADSGREVILNREVVESLISEAVLETVAKLHFEAELATVGQPEAISEL